tara:strand:- start:615 stop:953 length:339 start_codon:yes stop_codon:yes gene_type:complete
MASGTKKQRLRQRKRTQQKNFDRVTDQIRGMAVNKFGPQMLEKGARVGLGNFDRSPIAKRPKMQQPRNADGSGSEIVIGDYLGPDVTQKTYDARVALNRRAAAQKARRNRGR